MLLFEPPPSQADLHFRVLGIPVRIHPFFWITAVFMGLNREGTPPAELIIWIGVVFFSILVHELGHALTQRRFGGHPWITLHGIGGLASCDDCDDRPRSRILIALAGPAAGFGFAALVIAALALTGRLQGFEWSPLPVRWALIGQATVDPTTETFALAPVDYLIFALLQVNIFWGLVNLIPVYPLDGGQVMRELCTITRPRQGIVLSLRISVAAGSIMALVGLFVMDSFYVAAMFAYLAFMSYRTLQSYESQQFSRW